MKKLKTKKPRSSRRTRAERKPAPGLLSTEAAKERIEWARDLQKEPCNWREMFKSYADFNSGERGDEVA